MSKCLNNKTPTSHTKNKKKTKLLPFVAQGVWNGDVSYCRRIITLADYASYMMRCKFTITIYPFL